MATAQARRRLRRITVGYDRKQACDFALKYARHVCPDDFVGVRRRKGYAPTPIAIDAVDDNGYFDLKRVLAERVVSRQFDYFEDVDHVRVRGPGLRLLPHAATIGFPPGFHFVRQHPLPTDAPGRKAVHPELGLEDCTHFVSSCVMRGGGLKVPRDEGKRARYDGIFSAHAFYETLLDSELAVRIDTGEDFFKRPRVGERAQPQSLVLANSPAMHHFIAKHLEPGDLLFWSTPCDSGATAGLDLPSLRFEHSAIIQHNTPDVRISCHTASREDELLSTISTLAYVALVKII